MYSTPCRGNVEHRRREVEKNGRKPGSGQRAAGLRAAAASRQVWGCKGAAQPMEQTTERRMYSRPSPPLSPLSTHQAPSARYPVTMM